MSRDADLDELERLIRAPDESRAPSPDGSTCWRDQRRICGGDCVAYNFGGIGVHPSDPIQAHTQCLLIVIRMPSTKDPMLLAAEQARIRADDERRERALREMSGNKVTP